EILRGMHRHAGARMRAEEGEERVRQFVAAPGAKRLVGESRVRRKLVVLGIGHAGMHGDLPLRAGVEEVAELDAETLGDGIERDERGTLPAILEPAEITTRDADGFRQGTGRHAMPGPELGDLRPDGYEIHGYRPRGDDLVIS